MVVLYGQATTRHYAEDLSIIELLEQLRIGTKAIEKSHMVKLYTAKSK